MMLLRPSVRGVGGALCALIAVGVFGVFFVLVVSVGEGSASASVIGAAGVKSDGVAGGTVTVTPTPQPIGCPGAAYHYLKPHRDAPRNGGVAVLGQQFSLDMMVRPGSYYITAQQAYLTFTYTI